MLHKLVNRLGSLGYLARPLLLTALGVALLSAALAVLASAFVPPRAGPVIDALMLRFLPYAGRAAVFFILGTLVLGTGLYWLTGVVLLRRDAQRLPEAVVDMRMERSAPTLAVLSGGAGLLMLANIGQHARRMTCITPLQDPVEYYYRASNIFRLQNVFYVVPTPAPASVYVELDDGSCHLISQVVHNEPLMQRHARTLLLAQTDTSSLVPLAAPPPATRAALEAISSADAIIFGPGGLYDSILPNLLIPEIAAAIRASKARKIYICNLMTEPGLTTGFSVADHIRTFRTHGGFTPDYVLVNVQRIEPEIRQLYEAANYRPVYLTPEEYEETVVLETSRGATRDVLVEGSVVIEADLVSTVVQVSASPNNPGETRAVRVLRHDPDKLTAALLHILRRAP